ncbi:rodlin [Streptomyces litchfieldiae]|uniref:Rodlin n=1 Tax=Streptomyces litchfieldiae TaxID=3075543 RepID=A0ABU2MZ86_9ACTN|nr:rodlin [Streptomyces sp. DSM 44938]MDT0346976.1 rodlin [Streptomyces sp. DSM 44938]
MIKKTLATVAVAAGVVGSVGLAASPALAIGGDNENGSRTINGNGADQVYGNTTTGGYMSPNISLINGSLNKPCVAVPIKDIQNVVNVLAIPIGVQDVLSSENGQYCTENSTQTDGDDPLSHLLSDLSLLSENGVSKH